MGTISRLPLFLPGLVMVVIVAVLAAPLVARRLSTRPMIASLLIAGVGLTLAATLTPDHDALFGGEGSVESCDISRLGLAPLSTLMRVNEASLNVALFVPAGFALGLLPWNRRSARVAVGLFALPVVIEGLQLAIPILGRGCQTADVIDNMAGLALGLVFGTIVRWVGRAILGDGA